jgi:uncharacterized protein DUF6748
MVLRRLLVAAVCVTVAFGAFSASAGTSTSADQASVYRLRSDPRLCPSPMCGGFWASRVNRTSTACRDGAAHAACYIASVDLSGLRADVRVRARSALGSGRALVTGAFAAYSSNEFPQLAKLVTDRVWLAAGTNHEIGTVYRVVDTGLRCIRAPCFSLRATVVNGTHSLTLSSLDLTRTGASAAAISRAHAALNGSGVLAAGVVRATSKPGSPGAGRTLVAAQVWLSA